MSMMTRARSLLQLFCVYLLLGQALAWQASAPVQSKPWCEAEIDYTAANEFIEAHYGELDGRKTYFSSSRKLEPIFNAREGVYDFQEETLKPASLACSGFTLLHAPTQVQNWKNLSEIREKYLPELRKVLKKQYADSRISHIVFWCPTLRDGSFKQSSREGTVDTPTAGWVASAHIDTDVNAYDGAEHLIDIVEKNRFQEGSFPMEELVSALQNGQRFAVVNAWRNIASMPIARAPLAFMFPRYPGNMAFPNAPPDLERSRWYTYPEMQKDELLLFCQYDRDVANPSDLWHCALLGIGEGSAPDRESFDVRCFIVFDEIVPEERDRFGKARRGSLLSQEESAKFCSEQARRRRQDNDEK